MNLSYPKIKDENIMNWILIMNLLQNENLDIQLYVLC